MVRAATGGHAGGPLHSQDQAPASHQGQGQWGQNGWEGEAHELPAPVDIIISEVRSAPQASSLESRGMGNDTNCAPVGCNRL